MEIRGRRDFGICMANFPEFSLYNFLPQEVKSSMSTAVQDNITRWLLYIFVDGKFYTLFSLLFGIGFSIIIRNAERKKAADRCQPPLFLSVSYPVTPVCICSSISRKSSSANKVPQDGDGAPFPILRDF